MQTIYDKLAKALAYRKYDFLTYVKDHEYVEGDHKAREAWLDCKFYSDRFVGLSNEDIETLLDNQPVN